MVMDVQDALGRGKVCGSGVDIYVGSYYYCFYFYMHYISI